VILDVPVTMGNEFQNQVGYLDWQFMIEEFPVEDDDPKPPQTGDETELGLMAGLMAVSAVGIFVLLFLMKRKREEAEHA
jgi:LPXTG-motif cell wall-anchored protein